MPIYKYVKAQSFIGTNLDAYPSLVRDSVSQITEYWVKKLKSTSKNRHRFISRTGTLVSSIESEMYYLSGKVYIAESVAPYAKYVYRGQRSWAPDRFIHNAYNDLEPKMSDSITRVLDQAFTEYLGLK